jgi:hypothetical protein
LEKELLKLLPAIATKVRGQLQLNRTNAFLQGVNPLKEFSDQLCCVFQSPVVTDAAWELEAETKIGCGGFFPTLNHVWTRQGVKSSVTLHGVEDSGIAS